MPVLQHNRKHQHNRKGRPYIGSTFQICLTGIEWSHFRFLSLKTHLSSVYCYLLSSNCLPILTFRSFNHRFDSFNVKLSILLTNCSGLFWTASSSYYLHLHWLPLEQRIIFKKCSLMHRINTDHITVLNIFENLSRWHLTLHLVPDCVSQPANAMRYQRQVWSSVNGASRLQARLHGKK